MLIFNSQSLKVFHKFKRIVSILMLNPRVFVQKTLARISLSIVPSPKGMVYVRIGEHSIETHPSVNDWYKLMYLKHCSDEISHNIKKYLKNGDIFLDIGAGVGYFSAIASKIVGSRGKVYCFEPGSEAAGHIERMIRRNPGTNISLSRCAAGKEQGTNKYYVQRLANFPDLPFMVSMRDNFVNRVDDTIYVDTIRLDKWLEENKIEIVSLIKIDVEGYEYEVLKGLSKFFMTTKKKPKIICEITPPVSVESEYTLAKLQEYMHTFGYEARHILNPRIVVDLRSLNQQVDVVFISSLS